MIEKMAQAEKRTSCIDNRILIPLPSQAPEAATPQVRDKEPKLEEAKSQIEEKKLRNRLLRLLNKDKSIEDVKASVDARSMSYKNYQVNL